RYGRSAPRYDQALNILRFLLKRVRAGDIQPQPKEGETKPPRTPEEHQEKQAHGRGHMTAAVYHGPVARGRPLQWLHRRPRKKRTMVPKISFEARALRW